MSELITVPIFDMDIHLFKDREEAKVFFQAHSLDGEESRPIETARGVCLTNDQCRMLCVFDGGSTIAVHEAVHMAWSILKECGVKVSPSNDEPLAYLTAWLHSEMLKFLNQKELDNG